MNKTKSLIAAFATAALVTMTVSAQDGSTNHTATSEVKVGAPGTNKVAQPAEKSSQPSESRPRRQQTKQAEVASTNAVFGAITKTDDAYKSALDAHALDDALKLTGKDGAFKGTVAKIFEPRGLSVIEFDADYKTALTAIVRGTNFENFPVLTNLIGKEVLVSGVFTKYRETAQLVVEKPNQIKVVAAGK